MIKRPKIILIGTLKELSQKLIKKYKKKKQKQPSRSIASAGANAKKKYENGNVEFVCRSCKVTEDIPREVVEQFDMMDMVDPTDPPRFSCEKCGGEMLPVYYTSLHGITYKNPELKSSANL
ncbi:hypothetical protein SAMN05720591_101199 [Halolactibacillus alkaliphilus]|nr:hypothetical protein SAMN05720591_101199 [Halolactibacillus alkaliphilus]